MVTGGMGGVDTFVVVGNVELVQHRVGGLAHAHGAEQLAAQPGAAARGDALLNEGDLDLRVLRQLVRTRQACDVIIDGIFDRKTELSITRRLSAFKYAANTSGHFGTRMSHALVPIKTRASVGKGERAHRRSQRRR